MPKLKRVRLSGDGKFLLWYFDPKSIGQLTCSEADDLHTFRGTIESEHNQKAADPHERWATVRWDNGDYASHRRFYLKLVRG